MIEMLINYIGWNLCEAQAAAKHTSGGIRVVVWGKRKRLQDLEPFLWAGTDSNCRSREATDLQSARFNHLPTYPCLFSDAKVSIFFNLHNFFAKNHSF